MPLLSLGLWITRLLSERGLYEALHNFTAKIQSGAGCSEVCYRNTISVPLLQLYLTVSAVPQLQLFTRILERLCKVVEIGDLG